MGEGMRYYWMGHVKLSGIIEAASFEAACLLAAERLAQTPRDRWPAELLTVIPASEVMMPTIGVETLPS